jgi:hypothetical protein
MEGYLLAGHLYFWFMTTISSYPKLASPAPQFPPGCPVGAHPRALRDYMRGCSRPSGKCSGLGGRPLMPAALALRSRHQLPAAILVRSWKNYPCYVLYPRLPAGAAAAAKQTIPTRGTPLSLKKLSTLRDCAPLPLRPALHRLPARLAPAYFVSCADELDRFWACLPLVARGQSTCCATTLRSRYTVLADIFCAIPNNYSLLC